MAAHKALTFAELVDAGTVRRYWQDRTDGRSWVTSKRITSGELAVGASWWARTVAGEDVRMRIVRVVERTAANGNGYLAAEVAITGTDGEPRSLVYRDLVAKDEDATDGKAAAPAAPAAGKGRTRKAPAPVAPAPVVTPALDIEAIVAAAVAQAVAAAMASISAPAPVAPVAPVKRTRATSAAAPKATGGSSALAKARAGK